MDKIIENIGNATASPSEVTQRVPAGYDDLANWNNAKEYYVEKTLTSSQILALDSTAVTLVSALGAGKMIVPVKLACKLTYNSAAYANGSTIYIKGATSGVVSVQIPQGGLITVTNDYYSIVTLASGQLKDADLVNEDLVVQASGAAFITGDSSFTLKLWYYIADFN